MAGIRRQCDTNALGRRWPVLVLAAFLGSAAADAAAQDPAPEILRGSVAEPPLAVAVEPEAGPSEVIAAGDRIWFIDEDRGTLTGCKMVNTSIVGVRRVACARRPLPRP